MFFYPFIQLFKTGFFSFMCNTSFITDVFQFVAESMIFVFSWIELENATNNGSSFFNFISNCAVYQYIKTL